VLIASLFVGLGGYGEGMVDGGTVGDRLQRARRRRFVGRDAEIELFSAALGPVEEAPFSVLYVYGPGGVGKTALLGELTEEARRAGAEPVLVDARTVEPGPAAIRHHLEAAAARPDDTRRVIMIDTYELLAPVDDWVREQFLPGLPEDVLVVIAGRDAPSPRWRSDPGWRELLRVVSLRNLRPEDTRAYLRIEGVPADLHGQVLAMSHGHPLTMSLIVDMVVRRQPDPAVPRLLAEAPDIVRALLSRVIDQVPSARHGEALQICAHARFTTEELLHTMLGGDDSAQLFGWLRTQSFIQEGPYGLYPHDIARDVLDADLRWRAPVEYARLHRRLRAHYVERIRLSQGDHDEKSRHVADILFLSRSHPVISSYWQLTGLGELRTEELRPADRGSLLAMTRELQGEEQAALVEYWMERQPQAFVIFRATAGEIFGYAVYLVLHEASADDLDHDPGARAMWEYALRHGQPRPGESVMAWRFFVDTEPEPRPSRAETLIRLRHGEEIITHGGRAWDIVCVPSDRGYWDPLLAHFDFHHAPEARFETGGRPYDVYAHDWRRLGVDDWLDLTAGRELGEPVTPPTGPAPELVLSQPEFADAVRAALRDLHRPERLSGNPLLQAQLVRRPAADGRDPADVLKQLLAEAAGMLRGDPREESLYRVIDRTFLRPAPTQERAAEVLELPFSTYRRYRNRAVERITAWLWQQELYGPDAIGRQIGQQIGQQVDTA
jgi:hypothetical protein